MLKMIHLAFGNFHCRNDSDRTYAGCYTKLVLSDIGFLNPNLDLKKWAGLRMFTAPKVRIGILPPLCDCHRRIRTVQVKSSSNMNGKPADKSQTKGIMAEVGLPFHKK